MKKEEAGVYETRGVVPYPISQPKPFSQRCWRCGSERARITITIPHADDGPIARGDRASRFVCPVIAFHIPSANTGIVGCVDTAHKGFHSSPSFFALAWRDCM